MGACIRQRRNLALNATGAKAAWNNHAIVFGEFFRGLLKVLRLDHLALHPGAKLDAGVGQGLEDALIGILEAGVFPDKGDAAAPCRMEDTVKQLPPVVHPPLGDGQPQETKHLFVKTPVGKLLRDFVDRVLDILLLDYVLAGDVAEEGEFSSMLLRHGDFRAAHQHVGEESDVVEDADGLLAGLGLQLPGGVDEGHQRQVNDKRVADAGLVLELAHGLQKGEGLNVPGGAPYLRHHNVNAFLRRTPDGGLDFVGDVGDHLDGGAKVLPLALAGDDAAVDSAAGVVAVAVADHVGKALVVPEVQVRLGPVVGHIDLAVLVGGHRAWVHIQIGVELLHRDTVAVRLEQIRQAGGGNPLSKP